MPTEIVLLLLLIAVILTIIGTRIYLQKEGEQSEAWRWANYSTPLIFEQYNHTDEAALIALRQYENALAKLKEHGNKYLLMRNDKGEIVAPYVQKWIWKTDLKVKTDFEAWKFENVSREVKLWEDFWREKGQNARAKGQEAEAARFFAMSASAADFEKDENGQY